jgi:hypothetical protein
MNIAKRGCVHCHNVKEQQESTLARLGRWSRDLVWRFPTRTTSASSPTWTAATWSRR